jgi:hypothetical protein
VDFGFFTANVTKVLEGGYVPAQGRPPDASIQNNSGLSQGLAGLSVAG